MAHSSDGFPSGDLRLNNPSAQDFGRWDYGGAIDEYGATDNLPVWDKAAQTQNLANRIAQRRNTRIVGDAQGILGQGLRNLQTYRPGGAAALMSPFYSQMAQVALSDRQDAPDLMHNYMNKQRDDAKRESKRAGRRALAGQIIGAVGQVGAAYLTGGASLAVNLGKDGAGAGGGGSNLTLPGQGGGQKPAGGGSDNLTLPGGGNFSGPAAQPAAQGGGSGGQQGMIAGGGVAAAGALPGMPGGAPGAPGGPGSTSQLKGGPGPQSPGGSGPTTPSAGGAGGGGAGGGGAGAQQMAGGLYGVPGLTDQHLTAMAHDMVDREDEVHGLDSITALRASRARISYMLEAGA